MNNIVIVVIVAALLYMLMGSTGNAATTTTQVEQGCLQTLKQQYRPQWEEMSQLERGMVGLRMSACEGGR